MAGFDPYASGVLKEEHHARIVANLGNFALDAGINRRWICTSMTKVCSDAEVDYVRQFNRLKSSGSVDGLCLVGTGEDASVETRMAAMTGALVRNFVRARMMTLGVVLDAAAKAEYPEATCLLIPNFSIPKAEGGHIAPWQISALYDLLVHRAVAGQQTVVAVADMNALAKEYGLPFQKLLTENFTMVDL